MTAIGGEPGVDARPRANTETAADGGGAVGSRTKVALVDSGGANIGSVQYALDRLGVRSALTADPATITAADRVILPGVGAAGIAMGRLADLGLTDVLRALQVPLLGICLGMQLLFDSSEEGADAAEARNADDASAAGDGAAGSSVAGSTAGETVCLGLIPGKVRRMFPAPGVRIPHIGWNQVDIVQDDFLVAGAAEPGRAGFRAYFVHSFAAPVTPDTIATFTHGTRHAAVVGRGNVRGAQFHPERSSTAGLRLLANFVSGATV